MPPEADWSIQPGSIRDYRQLAAFHYIAGPPAAHKRVYVIRPGESARDLAAPEVAAVLVVSPPLMCVRGRNIATFGRYLPSGGVRRSQRQCVALLNTEMECISRVIVHPIYRGLGLSVRLVRHALQDGRTPLMEALAVMGRIHPFFAKGGMTGVGLVPGRKLLYSYYIAHTAQGRPVIDWLWEKEAKMKNSE
jgi:GNAT superfamily N-acetyltransferase